MEKKEKDLVNRLYQDATVGRLAIDKILKKVKSEALKKTFAKQYEMYDAFADKCGAIAMENNFEIKENSFFKKIKQTTMLYFMMWTDGSDRHLVEMMINGTVMGIVDTIKAEKDLKTKNENLRNMVVEFKQIQEDFYEKLKKQLAKV